MWLTKFESEPTNLRSKLNRFTDLKAKRCVCVFSGCQSAAVLAQLEWRKIRKASRTFLFSPSADLQANSMFCYCWYCWYCCIVDATYTAIDSDFFQARLAVDATTAHIPPIILLHLWSCALSCFNCSHRLMPCAHHHCTAHTPHTSISITSKSSQRYRTLERYICANSKKKKKTKLTTKKKHCWALPTSNMHGNEMKKKIEIRILDGNNSTAKTDRFETFFTHQQQHTRAGQEIHIQDKPPSAKRENRNALRKKKVWHASIRYARMRWHIATSATHTFWFFFCNTFHALLGNCGWNEMRVCCV